MAYGSVLAIGEGVAVEGVRTSLQSFEAFYAAEHRRVLAICCALAGGRTAAEDVAQEAFIKAYIQWPRVRVMEHPEAWVRRVAVNVALSRRRRLMSEGMALTRLARRPDRAAAEPLDDDFWAAVRRLPNRQAQAVALRYADDLSVADIALVMGCAEGTVKAHLHAARQALVSLLQLEGEGGS